MAIRFKKYKHRNDKNASVVFRAIRVTDKNIHELVDYIRRNGGQAFVTNAHDGKPMRIRIKQRTWGKTWFKRDWRVAEVGDFILRHDFANPNRFPINEKTLRKVEYERVKEDDFKSFAIAI